MPSRPTVLLLRDPTRLVTAAVMSYGLVQQAGQNAQHNVGHFKNKIRVPVRVKFRIRIRVSYRVRNKICGRRPCCLAVYNGRAVCRLDSVLAS